MPRISDFLAMPAADALPRVNAARRDLTDAILSLSRERDRLLLADGSDDQIRTLDAEADQLQLQLERLGAVEMELHRRAQPILPPTLFGRTLPFA